MVAFCFAVMTASAHVNATTNWMKDAHAATLMDQYPSASRSLQYHCSILRHTYETYSTIPQRKRYTQTTARTAPMRRCLRAVGCQ